MRGPAVAVVAAVAEQREQAAEGHRIAQAAEWWPSPNDVSHRRSVQLDDLAAPSSPWSAEGVYHSCGCMINECCRQNEQAQSLSGGPAEDRRVADPFHDPRSAGDRTLTCIADMMACCQTVGEWSPETNAVAAVLALRLCMVHAVTYGNRERVMLISLLLAQKLIDDLPLINADFPEVYRIWDSVDRATRDEEGMGMPHEQPYTRRTQISQQQLNALEVLMLQKLNFDVYVGFSDTLYVMMVSLPFAESDGTRTTETRRMMDRVTRRTPLLPSRPRCLKTAGPLCLPIDGGGEGSTLGEGLQAAGAGLGESEGTGACVGAGSSKGMGMGLVAGAGCADAPIRRAPSRRRMSQHNTSDVVPGAHDAALAALKVSAATDGGSGSGSAIAVPHKPRLPAASRGPSPRKHAADCGPRSAPATGLSRFHSSSSSATSGPSSSLLPSQKSEV